MSLNTITILSLSLLASTSACVRQTETTAESGAPQTTSGVEHWHGAAPATAMAHLAFQEQVDGDAVEWGQKVPDDQYR